MVKSASEQYMVNRFLVKQQSKQQNTQFAHLNASNWTQNFSINRKTILFLEWYKQLQILPVSFVKGSKLFDTSALIGLGSQVTFQLDKIFIFLDLPLDAKALKTL